MKNNASANLTQEENKPTIISSSSDYKQWYDKEFYVDKTYIIDILENDLVSGSALFFARPRRWGKTLFLSTLKHLLDKDLYKKEYS